MSRGCLCTVGVGCMVYVAVYMLAFIIVSVARYCVEGWWFAIFGASISLLGYFRWATQMFCFCHQAMPWGWGGSGLYNLIVVFRGRRSRLCVRRGVNEGLSVSQ